jgi:hypothetical protein
MSNNLLGMENLIEYSPSSSSRSIDRFHVHEDEKELIPLPGRVPNHLVVVMDDNHNHIRNHIPNSDSAY